MINYKIVENLGILSINKYDWQRELNLVEYADGTQMYEIREWSPNHKESKDGIVLNEAEAEALASIIVERFFNKQEKETSTVKSKTTIIDFNTRKEKTTENIEFPF